jgi:hypothetical protein
VSIPGSTVSTLELDLYISPSCSAVPSAEVVTASQLTCLTSSFFNLSNPEKYLADFVEKALGTARVLDSPMPTTTTHRLLPEDNHLSEI